MREFKLHDTKDFEVITFGNGLSYLFRQKATRLEVFLQGDDAPIFEGEMDSWEYHKPDWDYNKILQKLWCDIYSQVAEASES